MCHYDGIHRRYAQNEGQLVVIATGLSMGEEPNIGHRTYYYTAQ